MTTTLQIPASGYIVVEASSYVTHVFSSHNAIVSVQIDESAGGGVDAAHNVWAGMFAPPDFQSFFMPISARRTYIKTAGTYTFRLEARREGDTDGNVILNYPVITATYFPTSYGAVSQIVSSEESGQFAETARAVMVTGPDGSSTTGAEVDLRELEVRAERLAADAERAQHQLADARLRAQLEALEKSRKATARKAAAKAQP